MSSLKIQPVRSVFTSSLLRETPLSSMILPFIFSLLSSSVRISWNFLARAALGVAGKNPTVLAGWYQLVFDINFFFLLSSDW